MPVTLEQVRAALAPEELDYKKAARDLGEESLPHLERLVATAQPLLASKAAYLAGVIGTAGALGAIERAARSGDASVRIAAAAAVEHLPAESASDVLLSLVDDADVGVQKTALRSVPNEASAVLRARVQGLSRSASSAEVVRSLSLGIMARAATEGVAPGAAKAAAAGGGAKAGAKGGGRARGGAKGASKKAASKKGASKKAASKKAAGKKSSRGRAAGKKRGGR